jgi:hypothetical protein
MKLPVRSVSLFVPLAVVCGLVACAVPAAAKVERTVEKTFAVQPGGTLRAETQGGAITVRSGGGHEVKIVVRQHIRASSAAEADELLKKLTLTLEQQGNDVTAVAKYESRPIGKVFGSWPPVAVDFVVTVPGEYNAELKTSGGDITVGDLRGRVQARTSGGDLRMERIDGAVDGGTSGGNITLKEGTATVKLHTSGGSVHVDRAGGPAEVSTSGGDVVIKSVEQLLRAATSGGDIKAVLTAAPRSDCSLSTSGGDIEIRLPKAAAVNLEAGTSGGEVDAAGLTITIAKGGQGKTRLAGQVNGGGPLLKLRTSGGDISIRTE